MRFNDNPFNGISDDNDKDNQNEKAKAMDYYGTAMQVFPVAQADLINVEDIFNNIIDNNDFNILGFKVRRRRRYNGRRHN